PARQRQREKGADRQHSPGPLSPGEAGVGGGRPGHQAVVGGGGAQQPGGSRRDEQVDRREGEREGKPSVHQDVPVAENERRREEEPRGDVKGRAQQSLRPAQQAPRAARRGVVPRVPAVLLFRRAVDGVAEAVVVQSRRRGRRRRGPAG
ncbi:MAG: hypothetical protein BJ554DRAFT_6744, partial [Olpidium bornovanus]